MNENKPIRKWLKVQDLKISYLDNGNLSAPKTVLALPGGVADSSFFINHSNLMHEDIRLIAPDYPGRGNSDPLPTCTILNITNILTELIKSLKLQNITIVAHSLGTMVANQLSVATSLDLKEVILIAPGEFFSTNERRILKTLFFPLKYSKVLRRLYWNTLVRTGVFEKEFNVELQTLLNQWYETLNYKIDTRVSSNVPAIFIELEQDKIVNKNSLKKLQLFYTKNKTIYVNVGHTYNRNKESEDRVNKVLCNLLRSS